MLGIALNVLAVFDEIFSCSGVVYCVVSRVDCCVLELKTVILELFLVFLEFVSIK